jgi:hypothetical protein
MIKRNGWRVLVWAVWLLVVVLPTMCHSHLAPP